MMAFRTSQGFEGEKAQVNTSFLQLHIEQFLFISVDTRLYLTLSLVISKPTLP
jgi:hypothetical protein